MEKKDHMIAENIENNKESQTGQVASKIIKINISST